uniref:Uncharacterized protein n=1 Tax=Chenopodium quinoa TaxID=63459 RepID=A0A803MLI4_CHEQI
MVEPPAKMLREYAMPDVSSTSASIVRPSVQANNFELKPALIHIVQQDQFGGSPTECPLEHLANFLEKCDTIKINGVSEDAIRLSERSVAKKSTGMYDVDGINMLNAKVDNLTKIFSKMSNVSLISSPDLSCDNCGGAHASSDCLNFEQAQYVSNYNRSQNDPYSNTYNPGWKNHPNFSWRDQGTQGTSHNDDIEVLEMANALEACPPWKKRGNQFEKLEKA